MKEKIILDLCGGTGSWSKPYKDAGYSVVIVTLPTDIRLIEFLPEEVYGILAAPPCTHFSLSGARFWKQKGDEKLLEGMSVVDACLRFILLKNPVFWCLENPVGRLKKYLGDPIMSFNPCDYGDPYTKKTLLWGKFNKPKKNPIEPEYIIGKKDGKRYSPIHYATPGKDRAAFRSITPLGFAKAFMEANP